MKKFFVMILILIFISGNAYAQTATPRVQRRQVNQQQRIKEGVRSGELTRREAVRMEARQARIQHDKKVAKSDGVVTPEERAKLNREQNAASRRIYREKHDAQKRK